MAATNVLRSRKRLLVVLIVLVALMVLLIVRVGYWNIVRGEWLQEQAEIQWINDTEVPAKRGSIVDRHMNVLAQSANSDTVVLLPQNIEDPNQVAEQLSAILEMPKAEVLYKASTKTRTGSDGKEQKIGEVWLKRQIPSDQSEQIKGLELKGVKLIPDTKRFYPNKSMAAQVIGYTTLDGEGQTGLERRYNKELEGRQGRMVAETDKLNNDIPNGQEMFIEPLDGENVVLTIDEIVQSFLAAGCQQAYTDLAPEGGVQGAVMDVTTGELLGMSNIPEFDLNDPPRQDAETLSALSANRITASPYQPGNIMCWFTGAAALDAGQGESTYTCTGVASAEGETILCGGVHGAQSFSQAVENECSAAASEMSSRMGKQGYYTYLRGFGFGEKTGIDYTTDTAGDVLKLKYATNADITKMGAGENMKISQMQLLCAAASLANGGQRMQPRLVLGTSGADGTMIETYAPEVKAATVSQASADGMVEIMRQAAAGIPELNMPGYSCGVLYGSAQKYDAEGAVMEGRQVVTMIAFAPAGTPKYMVMVTLDGVAAGEGADVAAAPYVRQVLEETLQYNFIEPDGGNQPQEMPVQPEEQLVTVPNVVEMAGQTAVDTLTQAGLAYRDDGAGTVVAQTPAAGEQMAAGTEVFLEMDNKRPVEEQPEEGQADGAVPAITIPDFSGLSFQEARDLAISSGVKFYAKGMGKAVGQYPAAGEVLPQGTAVTVTFRLDIQ